MGKEARGRKKGPVSFQLKNGQLYFDTRVACVRFCVVLNTPATFIYGLCYSLEVRS